MQASLVDASAFPCTHETPAGISRSACTWSNARDGEPVETEEMAPRWFDRDRLPLGAMWPDDAYWLGRVLAGERLSAHFLYKNAREIAEWAIVPPPRYPTIRDHRRVRDK